MDLFLIANVHHKTTSFLQLLLNMPFVLTHLPFQVHCIPVLNQYYCKSCPSSTLSSLPKKYIWVIPSNDHYYSKGNGQCSFLSWPTETSSWTEKNKKRHFLNNVVRHAKGTMMHTHKKTFICLLDEFYHLVMAYMFL